MAERTVTKCEHCGTANRVPAVAAGVPHCAKCHTPLPWIAEANDATFAEVVERSPIPVLVDLWAPWCGPCRTLSPALERLARSMPGSIKLVKVNVDTTPGLSQRFDVQAIPTLLVAKGGRIVARQTGAPPEPALRGWLSEALASAA
jgi:thioredoxin 2